MKKLIYVFAVALMGLFVACSTANSSSDAEKTAVEEVATANDSTSSDSKCCGGEKPDCPSKSDSTHEHEHEHGEGEGHEHEHEHDEGEEENHDHNH